ncbi:MAG: DUF1573 domain-containing protein [Bacteroidota bacterium]
MRPQILSFFMLAALVWGTGCSGETHEHKPKNGKKNPRTEPSITWRNLVVRDTVTAGDSVAGEYIFYNSGWDKVVITSVEPKTHLCSCVAPTDSIRVGDQDTVRVKCLAEYAGPMNFTVNVKANTKVPHYRLNMHVQVEEAAKSN